MPKTLVRCRRLFTGLEDAPRSDQTFVVKGGLITHVDGDPLADPALLLVPGAIAAVHVGGRRVEVRQRSYERWKVSDFNSLKWGEWYTRERVAVLPGRL